MTVAEEDRACTFCGHWETLHDYGSPSYASDDGLPTFIGCFGDGIHVYDDERDEYPIPVCDCVEFDPGDDE